MGALFYFGGVMRVTFLEPRNNLEIYLPKLEDLIVGLVTDYGADSFCFGATTRFSFEAERIIEGLKEKYPYCDLVYVVADMPDAPPENERRPFPKWIYLSALAVFGRRDAAFACDVWIIDNSDIVVTYPSMDQKADRSFAEYACVKGKTIVMAD